MSRTFALFITVFTWVAPLSFAASINYLVTVDTSSIAGTAGSIDFNFNPGLFDTQPASLQILNFSTDGALGGSPTLIGNVSGTLPGTVTFDNGTGFNDYFEEFFFGSTLTFTINLYGPALDSPDGTATSGSGFAFSMFSDAAGTIPALTADQQNGFALTGEVSLDGEPTVENFSTSTSVVAVQSNAVPEPSTYLIVLTGLVLLGIGTAKRRSTRPFGSHAGL